jgi:hypothetical protein
MLFAFICHPVAEFFLHILTFCNHQSLEELFMRLSNPNP